MKNIDIEKLERKNRGQIPENFFEEIQNNVLSRTVLASENKAETERETERNSRFSIKWIGLSMAAAVALIFGISQFIPNLNDTVEDKPIPVVVNNPTNERKENHKIAVDHSIATNQAPEITGTAQSDQIENVKNEKPNATIKPVSQTVYKEQMDAVLSEMSEKDLADLGSGGDQDIYLDLYY